MSMDVDKILDIEKRTGIKNTDIDDFLSKASGVEEAIKALMSGDTAAIEKEEKKLKEKQEREAEEKRIADEKRERVRVSNEALRLKKKVEEREKWWSGAEFYVNRDMSEALDDVDADSSAVAKSQKKLIDKYTADYSRWDEWKPSDPVSVEEYNIQKEAEEKVANDLFEKNNPEFCTQTLADMKERRASQQAKAESSNEKRLRGNNLFKKGQTEDAHQCYIEALKLSPYDTKILMNIAQCDIKLNHFDDAMEFLSRLLYCEPDHVKGLSRKAFILKSKGEIDEALKVVLQALKKEPTNTDLLNQKSELDDLINENKRKKQVDKLTTTLSETIGKPTSGSTSSFSSTAAAASSSLSTEEVKKADAKKAEVLLSSLSKMSEDDSYALMGIHLLDSVNGNLDALLASFDVKVDESGNVTESAGSSADLDALGKSLVNIELCETSIKSDANLKLYFRTSGMLGKLSKFISNIVTKTSFIDKHNKPIGEYMSKEAGKGAASCEVKFVYYILRLLAAGVYNDRISTEAMMDCGVVSDVLGALSKVLDPYLIFGFMKICQAVIDKINTKSKNPFLKTPKTLYLFNDIVMGSANILLQTTATTSTGGGGGGKEVVALPTAVRDIVEDTVITGISIFKSVVTTEWYREVQTFELMQSFILSTSFSVHMVLSTSSASSTSKSSKAAAGGGVARPNSSSSLEAILPGMEGLKMTHEDKLQLMLEALLGMSQSESSRVVFNQKFTQLNSSAKGELSSAIDILFNSFCKSEKYSGNNELNQLVTGTLLNITIGDANNDIKNSIFKAGGLDYSMSGLKYSEGKRAEIAKADNSLSLVRKASLLSRLVLLEPVQTKLSEVDNYSIIIKYVASSGVRFNQLTSWQSDELSHVIRVLAGVTKLSPSLLAVVKAEKACEALVMMMPKPRDELGVITPMSVVLPPANKISDNLVGNIARCLMHCADDSELCKIIFNDGVEDNSRRISSNFGTEKLICAMATSSDMKVRKNIAILLAKGSRVPIVRERVTNLRGMQMIIELNNSKQLL